MLSAKEGTRSADLCDKVASEAEEKVVAETG
jgi:hypothetical protein